MEILIILQKNVAVIIIATAIVTVTNHVIATATVEHLIRHVAEIRIQVIPLIHRVANPMIP